MTTGLELKLLRVAARVRTSEMADAMGVSASRVSAIESRDVVTDGASSRYRVALATLATGTTSPERPSKALELEATA